jgi:hypothetical protein
MTINPKGVQSKINTSLKNIKKEITVLQNQAKAIEAKQATHATQHEASGTDEIDVTGLSGTLADPQTPVTHQHLLFDITDSGTAAAENVPAAGDASVSEVVKGDDSRLTDARTPSAHNHVLADVTDSGTAAAKDVPASGDAAAGEVVQGDDTRLTDKRAPVNNQEVNGYRQKVLTPLIDSGSITFDLDAANDYNIDFDQNITDIAFANMPPIPWRGVVTLYLVQGTGGGFTVTWPVAVKWVKDVAPTLSLNAGEVDIIQLDTIDGGLTWRGVVGGIGWTS